MEKYNSFEEISKAYPIGSTTEKTYTEKKYFWDEEPETPEYITFKVFSTCIGYYYDGEYWMPNFIKEHEFD